MSKLRNAYHNICARIYSVGKLQFEKRIQSKNYEGALVGQGSKFYRGTEIINFSKEKSKIVIGRNCHIYGSIVVMPYGGMISFGDNCSFGDMSRMVSCKEIRIGNRVMIAHNVNILDGNSHPLDAKLRHEDFMNNYSFGVQEYDLKEKKILIEDDVWIGFNSIILKGVKIGRGAIIGAGSVVTKDVEPWTVNVGNPLRCIYKLEPLNF
jgi:acetyltransferase-like isoleucine patch superfamily enzyme